jgi:hypothetical protein
VHNASCEVCTPAIFLISCFAAALLLLYCCFAAALLLLYLNFLKCASEGVHNACYVKSARLRVPESLRALFLVSGFTAALLLLYCCFTQEFQSVASQ